MMALMKQQTEHMQWKIYTANSLGALVTRLFRWSGAKDFEYPLYSEMGKPKAKQPSAEEIKQHVLEKLTS